MNIPKLKIGDLIANVPIIQGGMGVAISRSKLAAAVAKEGAIGVISAAQIGFDQPDFETNTVEANKRALREEIRKAKEMSGNKIIGVNIMVALKNYADYVKVAIEEKIDLIISGAGLPTELPKLVENTNVKIVPIVSSKKAAKVIMEMWEKKFNRRPDAIVVEGPEAGGHLGFKIEELEDIENHNLKDIVHDVLEYLKELKLSIPVIPAGGIFTGRDIAEYLKMGASGVQMATRFVTTHECDASDAYKQAYIDAKKEDIQIIKSPVGMPGRAIRNEFIKRIEVEKDKITKCYGCLRKCNPAEIPYCITKSLVNAVKGNIDDALLFVGSNAYRCDKIISVKELIDLLMLELKEA
ncbi:MAG: 2-nitropropane dioxygenase [Clostridiales bacterium GWE2_32_10]|nr:MAG: 2-nitropropane dioxygenase [Clostridiales bacterium GWE2_32_10]